MPVSIVVGGQYGSEGKGKVAHFLARRRGTQVVVRVGGSNSGHTTMGSESERLVLRQLPTASLEPETLCVLAAGSYIEPALLFEEMKRVELAPDRLWIDPNAMVITDGDRDAERTSNLTERIGSTGSGTGAAVARRIGRQASSDLASGHPELAPFVRPVRPLLTESLLHGERVLIEGTQGFGLSLLHTPHYPKATSRDTTAAGALSEIGLSPLDVDEVVLVIRSFPIRVPGDSGPFGAPEIDWETIRREGGHSRDLAEYTSVTKRIRRVARFDPEIVRGAIAANKPTSIVLNHVDHVDAAAEQGLTDRALGFVDTVAEQLGQPIDLIGLGPDVLVEPTAKPNPLSGDGSVGFPRVSIPSSPLLRS